MITKTISLKYLSELPSAAKAIFDFSEDRRIFCFYGELGAGKTTLIKELCKQLGVTDAGSSPTFSLINEYKTAIPVLKVEEVQSSASEVGSRDAVYHFDFYRIKNEIEAFDIGFEEYLDNKNYCFIEWPEKIERLLLPGCVKVKIEVKEGERIISIS
ncbi:MAG: tRNA (adenosine(37)-N6)-threonylcarbamoyltransferase complex ATPase subunit type 1 TsaE [Bacteroidetes bacterium]|nr:MAG: tRNA (adenosine(37)-N6)-threonylcarbamoyltransferase complex ATPase subunit type 1 TsaE [Bacteroidota bacterium]